MPENGIKPLFDSWPECGHRVDAIGAIGAVLTCTLPLHHERDGTDWHSDGQAQWRMTVDDTFEVIPDAE